MIVNEKIYYVVPQIFEESLSVTKHITDESIYLKYVKDGKGMQRQ